MRRSDSKIERGETSRGESEYERSLAVFQCHECAGVCEEEIYLLLRSHPAVLERDDSRLRTHHYAYFSGTLSDRLIGREHDLFLSGGISDPVDIG